jgi:hypothetical protein
MAGSFWISLRIKVVSNGPGASSAKLNLGGIRFIDSFNLEWERAYSRDYVIQISDVGTDPVTVDDDGTGIGGDWTNVISPEAKSGHLRLRELNVRARFVRIFSYDGDPNYGISLYEFAIFGDSNGSCEIPPTCPGTFITLGAGAASASTIERSGYSPAEAVDGDMETRWASAFTATEWFEVDLGAPTLITSLWLFWARTHATDYKVYAGEMVADAIVWEEIDDITGSDGQVDIIGAFQDEESVVLPVVVTQYVRIVSSAKFSGNYGISLNEFEVHGNTDEGCVAPILIPE